MTEGAIDGRADGFEEDVVAVGTVDAVTEGAIDGRGDGFEEDVVAVGTVDGGTEGAIDGRTDGFEEDVVAVGTVYVAAAGDNSRVVSWAAPRIDDDSSAAQGREKSRARTAMVFIIVFGGSCFGCFSKLGL